MGGRLIASAGTACYPMGGLSAARRPPCLSRTLPSGEAPVQTVWTRYGAAARAVIRIIRHINAELLLLASEAMFRPVGAPQPRSRAEMPVGPPPERTAAVTERARRAA